MCSEDLDCGICYEPYNAARRCPRELRCEHSFCESCLVALCPDESIACPLCRRVTHLPGGAVAARVRALLRVDERVLERMLSAGVPLDDVTTAGDHAHGDGEGTDQRTPDAGIVEEGGDSSSGSRDGRLGKSLKKMWRKIIGSKRRGDARNCMSDEEFRDFAMLSFYTF